MRSPRVSDQKPVKSLENSWPSRAGRVSLGPSKTFYLLFSRTYGPFGMRNRLDLAQSDSAGEQTRSMDVRIKATISFSIGGGALEDSLAEYDELTVSGLLKEILDKAIACDGIQVEVVEGPNTLEEYDSQAQGA
jgi:hypothetical protein